MPVINIPLWDAAKWRGVAYATSAAEPPFVILLLENMEAGNRILQAWIDEFGEADVEEVIRVSFIDYVSSSDYAVSISTDPDGYFRFLGRSGKASPRLVTGAARSMHVARSNNLDNFRLAFARFGEYWLTAGEPTSRGLELSTLRIRKRRALIRAAADLPADDLDRHVLRI